MRYLVLYSNTCLVARNEWVVTLSIESTLIHGTTLPGPYTCLKHPQHPHLLQRIKKHHQQTPSVLFLRHLQEHKKQSSWCHLLICPHQLVNFGCRQPSYSSPRVPGVEYNSLGSHTTTWPGFAKSAAIPLPTEGPQTVRTVESVARLVPQQAITPQVVPHPVLVVDPEFKHGRMLWLLYMPKLLRRKIVEPLKP